MPRHKTVVDVQTLPPLDAPSAPASAAAFPAVPGPGDLSAALDDLRDRAAVEEKPIRRRKRRIQAAEPAAEPVLSPEAAAARVEAATELRNALGAVSGAPFDALALLRGPHWALGEEEKALLGRAVALCGRAYLDGHLGGERAPLYLLLVSAAAVILPRVLADVALRRGASSSPGPGA